MVHWDETLSKIQRHTGSAISLTIPWWICLPGYELVLSNVLASLVKELIKLSPWHPSLNLVQHLCYYLLFTIQTRVIFNFWNACRHEHLITQLITRVSILQQYNLDASRERIISRARYGVVACTPCEIAQHQCATAAAVAAARQPSHC